MFAEVHSENKKAAGEKPAAINSPIKNRFFAKAKRLTTIKTALKQYGKSGKQGA